MLHCVDLLNGLTEYMQEKESFSRLFSHLKRMNTWKLSRILTETDGELNPSEEPFFASDSLIYSDVYACE
jgi:hypothetical protein